MPSRSVESVVLTMISHPSKAHLQVRGLNNRDQRPFHDYQAWTALRRPQDLNIAIPDDHDVQAQRRQVEAGLRAQYGAPPATTSGDGDAP